jgi:hypothetical protein
VFAAHFQFMALPTRTSFRNRLAIVIRAIPAFSDAYCGCQTSLRSAKCRSLVNGLKIVAKLVGQVVAAVALVPVPSARDTLLHYRAGHHWPVGRGLERRCGLDRRYWNSLRFRL